jgi:putative endonuclease
VQANKRIIGNKGEEIATKILQKEGYRILEKNFRCGLGEIDLVTLKQGNLVFVEVKLRTSQKFGSAAEAVTERKIEKIKKVGLLYHKLHPLLPNKMRIEVVSIQRTNNGDFICKIIKADE